MDSLNKSDIEDSFCSALEYLGITIDRQFWIPSSPYRFDIYISQPIRAFIELKFSLEDSDTIYEQFSELTDSVMGSFQNAVVPILVHIVHDKSSVGNISKPKNASPPHLEPCLGGASSLLCPSLSRV